MAAGAFTAPLDAQSLRLLPSVGLYAPLSDFGRVRQTDLGEAVEFGKSESTLAFGLTAEIGSPTGAWTIRGNLRYASASEVPISGVGCETCSARSTLVVATGALAFRPFPTLFVVRPYLLAGAGISKLDFSRDSFADEGFRGALWDTSKPTGQLGIGTDVFLGGLLLFVEGNAFVSRFDPAAGFPDVVFESDSDLRWDAFLTAGVSLGL